MIIGYTTNEVAFRPLVALLDNYLMTAAEIGDHFRYSTERLAHLRRDGGGPPFIKLPTGGVRYPMSQAVAWQLEGEAGPLTLDRVALAVAACVSVPAEYRAAIIAHLEKAWTPMIRDAGSTPSAMASRPAGLASSATAQPEPISRRRGRPRKAD